MERSTTPLPEAVSKPLSNFQVIGHNTYLYTSPSYLSQQPKDTPLILLFAWNAAASKHIAKYTISYQKLFPTSRIILIRSFTRDMVRKAASYATLLSPAMDLVKEHVGSGGEVLVHSFSNGGGNQVNEFAKAWKGRYGTKMPMRMQALDSSPTKGPWMKSHAAIAIGLPKTVFWKWFGGALGHVLLAVYWLVTTAMGLENKNGILRRELNDPEVFDNRVPRVYLYSRADQMVGWEEVEEHATNAEGKGWDVVRVTFEGSAHCGHVREDEGRYWKAVMDAWKRGPRHP